MDIQNVLWKLAAVGDSSILAQEVKDAAKEAAAVLNDVRNLLNLGAAEDLATISSVVRTLQTGAIGNAFSPLCIAGSVANLGARHEEISGHLEWVESQALAANLEQERRIIQAAMATIEKEYGSKYFDTV